MTIQPVRPIDDLRSVTDCVEEALILVKNAYAQASLSLTQARADEIGYELYDGIEAIIRRAQEIPREVGPGSSPPTAQPAQPL